MSDLISREATKDVLANLGIDIEDYWEDAIDGLPSVEPEKRSNGGERMYSCVFETGSKSDYLLMLQEIDSKGWRRNAIGDDWNCIFRIEFDMHP